MEYYLDPYTSYITTVNSIYGPFILIKIYLK